MKSKIELLKADMKSHEKKEMAFALTFFGLSVVISLVIGIIRYFA